MLHASSIHHTQDTLSGDAGRTDPQFCCIRYALLCDAAVVQPWSAHGSRLQASHIASTSPAAHAVRRSQCQDEGEPAIFQTRIREKLRMCVPDAFLCNVMILQLNTVWMCCSASNVVKACSTNILVESSMCPSQHQGMAQTVCCHVQERQRQQQEVQQQKKASGVAAQRWRHKILRSKTNK